jgi:hypothetical protein
MDIVGYAERAVGDESFSTAFMNGSAVTATVNRCDRLRQETTVEQQRLADLTLDIQRSHP